MAEPLSYPSPAPRERVPSEAKRVRVSKNHTDPHPPIAPRWAPPSPAMRERGFSELRAELNARHASRGHLTLLPFLVRAIVNAVAEHPQVNARYDDEAGVLHRHNAVHAGIATQTEGGLLVPVLHHAEAFDLWQAAAEIARLADVARTGKATREELTGSTITITSLGALGGLAATPVINYPEVAIVGVNRIA